MGGSECEVNEYLQSARTIPACINIIHMIGGRLGYLQSFISLQLIYLVYKKMG